MLKMLTISVLATIMLSSCGDNGAHNSDYLQNNDGTFNVQSRMIEIDRETGFHYLKHSNNSSYMPRYCLTKDNTRGHLMTKDNKLECISSN
jgi:hypothetical protein